MTLQRPMPTLPRMTADEFFAWTWDHPEDRVELIDGELTWMPAEFLGHNEAKGETFVALREALRAAGIEGQVAADGMAVRIDNRSVFEPDALLRLGPRLSPRVREIMDPVVVVEVLSPSTKGVDLGRKLDGYFTLPSLRHYLVLDTEERVVTHHARAGAYGPFTVRTLRDGDALRLDPPGVEVPVATLFGTPYPSP